MPFLGHWYVVAVNLLLIGAVIWLAILAVRRFLPSETASALRVLNERFARGEIDQQEYDQRKAALRKNP